MHLNRKLFNFNTYSKFASTHSFFFPYRLLQQKKKGSENSENFDSEKKKQMIAIKICRSLNYLSD